MAARIFGLLEMLLSLFAGISSGMGFSLPTSGVLMHAPLTNGGSVSNAQIVGMFQEDVWVDARTISATRPLRKSLVELGCNSTHGCNGDEKLKLGGDLADQLHGTGLSVNVTTTCSVSQSTQLGKEPKNSEVDALHVLSHEVTAVRLSLLVQHNLLAQQYNRLSQQLATPKVLRPVSIAFKDPIHRFQGAGPRALRSMSIRFKDPQRGDHSPAPHMSHSFAAPLIKSLKNLI
jgi:hypothetical protein